MSLFKELEKNCKVWYDDDNHSYLKSDDIETYLEGRSLGTGKHEEAIAEGILSGSYSQKHAKLVCELQGLNWAKVDQEYNRMYAVEQAAGCDSWN